MRPNRLAVGITTVAGERLSLYAETVRSLSLAGLEPQVTTYDVLDGGDGPYGNFRRCLSELVKLGDACLVVQDDCEFSRNLAPWLETQWEHFWNERTGVVSLYCAGPHHRNEPGWFKLEPCEGKRAHGALALMMPQAAAKSFLENPPNAGCKTRTCYWAASWCGQTGRDYWLHSPSLVRHTGEKSLVSPVWDTAVACRPFRQCKRFCLDALTGETADVF